MPLGYEQASDGKSVLPVCLSLSLIWTLSEKESPDEIHLGGAAYDIGSSRVALSQLSDSPSFAKTHHLVSLSPPSTLLFTEHALPKTGHADGGGGGVAVRLAEEWEGEGTEVVSVPRKYWSDQAGTTFLEQLTVEVRKDGCGLLVSQRRGKGVGSAYSPPKTMADDLFPRLDTSSGRRPTCSPRCIGAEARAARFSYPLGEGQQLTSSPDSPDFEGTSPCARRPRCSSTSPRASTSSLRLRASRSGGTRSKGRCTSTARRRATSSS